ncbi:hypothetical protein B566_EDAN014102 [Ephemera danica]|nr:hypothetical protein B566_EDAN014102 [Ephemera danica]
MRLLVSWTFEEMEAPQKCGWLRVREDGDQNDTTRWCVLDNGVLWFHRRPGEQQGRDALPLHDAVVGDCEPPAPLHLAVRCRRSGMVFTLGALTKEDYASWMDMLTVAAREWRDKRRASVLHRQIMALGKEINDVKFTPRRRSEVPIRPTILPNAVTYSGDGDGKRLPLRDLVLSTRDPAQLRWAKLPEVHESGLLGLLSEEQVAIEELKFAALAEEFRFNLELTSLLRLATRAVSWKDPILTAFHRRSIAASVTKLKKSSDAILKIAENHWSQRVTMQSTVFALLGNEARNAGWCEAYTEYCSHLPELRELMKRAANDKREVVVAAFSVKYRLELALVPMQHLTTLRQLMQTIFELLDSSAPEQPTARATRDFLNEILDSCYQELTEQSGSEYVAEMDNVLQFDLSNVTSACPGPQLLYRRKARAPPPPIPNGNSKEDERQGRMSKTKNRLSIFNGAAIKSAAHYLRRRTAEGLGLRNTRTASMPNILLDIPADTGFQTSDDEDEETSTVEAAPSVEPSVVPRFFRKEPFFQEYCLSLAQEVADQARGEQNEQSVDFPQRRSGCTRWVNHPRVQDTGTVDELSAEERRLAEFKYEVLAAEASFLRSIRFLESHFAHCPEFYDEEILPASDRHLLFSGIEAHRTCSERFLTAMERCWEEDVHLEDLCSSAIKSHFVKVLTKLEANPACEGFTLLSFLALPLRHFGRLKILLDNIASLMGRIPEVKIEERAACESARDAVNRLIVRGESAARRTHSDNTLQQLAQLVSFRRVPRMALSAEGRALVHSGPWKVLARREEARGPMRAKSPYPDLQAILLTDLLLLVAPDGRSGGNAAVDYGARSDVQFRTVGPGEEEPLPGFLLGDEAAKHALYVMYRSHTGKLVEMMVNCGGASSQIRWLTTSNSEMLIVPPSPAPRSPSNLMLLRALKAHEPELPDEMRLASGDVVAVLRNPGDGWVMVRNLVDGSRGWLSTELTVQLCAGRKSVSFLVDPRYSIA